LYFLCFWFYKFC